jgi:hypothetical protein
MRRLTPVEIQKLIFLHESASMPPHRLAKRFRVSESAVIEILMPRVATRSRSRKAAESSGRTHRRKGQRALSLRGSLAQQRTAT